MSMCLLNGDDGILDRGGWLRSTLGDGNIDDLGDIVPDDGLLVEIVKKLSDGRSNGEGGEGSEGDD